MVFKTEDYCTSIQNTLEHFLKKLQEAIEFYWQPVFVSTAVGASRRKQELFKTLEADKMGELKNHNIGS